jgi:ABC-type multidrug transport system fused ATPase/permease subunit
VLKLIGLKCLYFLDSWNIFDFLLLLLSLFGIIMEFVASGADDGNNVSKEARLFRLNRMFRILRVLRLFRLFKIFALLKARLQREDISFQLAEHLKTISLCRAFAKAHINSQAQMILYLGENGSFSNAEQARCILESQTEVYKALAMASVEADGVDVSVHFFRKLLRESIKSVGKLSKFVDQAHSRGVISGREAETIMHSFDDHVRTFYKHMQKTVSGRRPSTESLGSLAGSEVPHEPAPIMVISDVSYPSEVHPSEEMLAAVKPLNSLNS